MILFVSVCVLAGIGSWFLRGWWLFRGTQPVIQPSTAYEVRVAITTHEGPVTRIVYAGDDLFVAKDFYKGTTGPKSSLVELWTRGNHTASRRL